MPHALPEVSVPAGALPVVVAAPPRADLLVSPASLAVSGVRPDAPAHPPHVHRAKPPPPPLTPEEKATVALFRAATPSVVFITSLVTGTDSQSLVPPEGVPTGAGSGFFWDSQGHVVTNYHVVKGASRVRVTFGDTSTADATVLGYDEDRDVAVLTVSLSKEQASKAVPLPVGSSSDLLVGQRVYAIGNPFGLDHTLTSGVVSGVGREIASGTSGRPINGVIQTDAAINPGNSGGPLLNSGGQVVGINTAIYSGSGTSSGVGFALPVDLVADVVDSLISTGRVARPVLGIAFAPDNALSQLGLGGVLVLDVRPDGPAAKAGVRATHRDSDGRLTLGDVIVSVDDTPVKTSGDLYRSLDRYGVGDTIKLGIERLGEGPATLEVTLEDRDALGNGAPK